MRLQPCLLSLRRGSTTLQGFRGSEYRLVSSKAFGGGGGGGGGQKTFKFKAEGLRVQAGYTGRGIRRLIQNKDSALSSIEMITLEKLDLCEVS